MSILFLPPQSAGSVTIADATETTSGKIRIATSAEATAGTNDVTAMTPAKVKSVVDASLVGGVTYQGTLDASAPADLSNATKGDLYIISVAGTYAGKTWAVGDHLLVNADMGGTLDSSKIDKVDNTDAVTSVAGRTGAVTLSTADISGLATVASTGAYSDLSGTPTLATVATTGAYSDLSGTPTLGTAAALDVGTSASNVVQLDGTGKLPAIDGSQLTNLPSSSLALNDLTDVTITGAATGEVLRYNGAEWVDAQLAYSDLSGTPTLATVATTGAYSDLSGTPTLGTAAALDVGTSANNVVQLDGTGKLPAVDGSQLTNLPGGDAFYQSSVSATSTATAISDNRRQHYDILNGGVTLTLPQGGSSSVVGGVVSVRNASTANVTFGGTTGVGPVFKTSLNANVYTMTIAPGETRSFVWNGTNALNEVSVSQLSMLGDVTITGAATGEVLRYNGTAWVDAQLAYSDLSGTPTLGTAAVEDVGTSAGNVVQLDGSARLPAVDGSQLTNLPASSLALDDLTDVTISSASSGQVLSYNGSAWVNAASSVSKPTVTSVSPVSTYTISTTSGSEEIFLMTPSVDCTVTLPTGATAGAGYRYHIKNLSANNLILSGTIDGSPSFTLSVQYSAVTIVSDGTNWFII
jgi:hypothetical protein